MLEATIIGCGGTMPLSGRWLSSFLLRSGGRSVLIDCGEGTQIAARQAGFSFKPIDLICLTHFHADHVIGLAGLLLSMGNEGRTDPVTILAPAGAREVVQSLCVVAPELLFPLEIVELEEREQTHELAGFTITSFPLRHGVPCSGYSFYLPRSARFDASRAQALGVPQKLWSTLQSGHDAESDGRVFRAANVLGPARRGIRVTYATDTRPVPAIWQVGKNSDLMVLEGMYGSNEKRGKALATGHMTFPEAAKIAARAEAARLWLTHYSPSLPDPENYLADILPIFPNAECGFDAKTITLNFPQEESDQ